MNNLGLLCYMVYNKINYEYKMKAYFFLKKYALTMMTSFGRYIIIDAVEKMTC